MDWQFMVPDGADSFTLKASRIFMNYQIEQIKVTGEGISIVLESNRPLLEAIELKKPLSWRIVKGKLNDNGALEKITKGLEHSLNYKIN
jgi:hypothetical protein